MAVNTPRPSLSEIRGFATKLLQDTPGSRSRWGSLTPHPHWNADATAGRYLDPAASAEGEPSISEWRWLVVYFFASMEARRFFLKGIDLADGRVLWPDRRIMGAFLKRSLVHEENGRFVLGERAMAKVAELLSAV